MKVLAVDTALGACSAAVLDDDAMLSHRFELMDRGHAERLAPMVREVMNEAGMAFAQLDRLGVTIGPGTFTGQRVGIAFMRGLRIALGLPLAGITTLEAMMAAASAESGMNGVAALHDARRDEVYCAASIAGRLVLPACLLPVSESLARIRLAVGDAPLAFAGTAGEAAARADHARGYDVHWSGVIQPDAGWVGRLARSAPEPSGPPKPLYLRAPDARLPTTQGP